MDNWSRYSKYVADKALATMRSENVTQAQLAKSMNRSQQYVSHILSGRGNLTLETISSLEMALGTGIVRDFFFSSETGFRGGSVLNDSNNPEYGHRFKSSLPTLASSNLISRRFETGDRPFLVICSDSGKYLTKAVKFGDGAYGLARELIGSAFCRIWGLTDSDLSLIRVLPEHSDGTGSGDNYSIPCLGRRWIEESIELTDKNHSVLVGGKDCVADLMKTALFDIWLSNEDRLNNNLNLLYSYGKEAICPIDHAGIFNTSFSAPLLLLSPYDSLLYSDMFSDAIRFNRFPAENLRPFYESCLEKCLNSVEEVREMIPEEWNIDKSAFDSLMSFIFSRKWVDSVFENFINILEQL